jgi:hypothetical protein
VIDQGEGVTASQLVQWPVLERDALDLHVEDSADSVVVRGIGAFCSGVTFGPGGRVVAEGVGAVADPVCLINRTLSIRFAGEGALAPVPGRLG